MLRNNLTILGLGLGLLAGSQAANAAIVSIDPDGPTGASGDVSVGMIDFLPGNALNKDAIVTPTQFTNYYQARVGSLVDGNGVVIQLPGLNDATSSNKYELTVVSRFDLVASYISNPSNFVSITELAPVQTVVNTIEIYYDPGMNANDLTGLGFDDGTLILKGTIITFSGYFGESVLNPPTALDQFGVNNYPNILSNYGVGGADAYSSLFSYINTNFIKSNVLGLYVSSSNAEPFRQVDPAQSVFGVTTNVGAINGQLGPDILVQADASASFIVPEPGTFMILGLSAAGLFIRRRK